MSHWFCPGKRVKGWTDVSALLWQCEKEAQMKKILLIHTGSEEELATVSFREQEIQVQRLGCNGDAEHARHLIAQHDGQVDAIGLEGMPIHLRLGPAHQ